MRSARPSGPVAAVLLAGAGALLVAGWLAWPSGERPPLDEVELARERLGIPLDSRRVALPDGISLHVVLAGPETGPPVLLLHGFPELWWTWEAQIDHLAAAGFRVAAPDLRGFNRSDKPPGPADYTASTLTSDAAALLDALGWPSAFVAGHDVGAGVVWRLVFEHPTRVRRAVVFNVGHPRAWEAARPEDDPGSVSWYRAFFRLPWLPELAARAGDWWLLARSLQRTARPGAFAPPAMDVFKTAWARENAISTMIHLYRAPQEPWSPPGDGAPAVPVRMVYGLEDAFIPRRHATLTREILGPDAVVEVPGAGHWILLEKPAFTSDVMVEYFGAR